MAPARTPRSRWIEEGLRALAAGGPDAVRVESLAQAIGVSKGGFYWYFDHRRALLDELLASWERMSVDEAIERVEGEAGAIERVEGEAGDARAILRRLFALAGEELLLIDLAVREWARRERRVATRLRRVDNRRMEYMRALFGSFCQDPAEVETRCMLAFSLWIGNHFIAADHDGRSRADVIRLSLKRLLS
jgi:AcrR family transcriptional regulator